MRTLLCAVLGWLALAAAAQQPPPVIARPEVQENRLIYRVPPVYPRLAREARIQGKVKLAAWIDEEGKVQRLRLISGHPLLVKAALDAVAQWRYRPALRAGKAVAVVTTVEIYFTLGIGSPAPPAGTVRV